MELGFMDIQEDALKTLILFGQRIQPDVIWLVLLCLLGSLSVDEECVVG
jgi:hypothetical protein